MRAVDGVSFSVAPGETLGVVGESGCGKSVTSLSILRLIASPPGRIVAGQVLFEGRDLLALTEDEMRAVRGNQISMIFQEPMTSLNPALTVGRQIAESLVLHRGLSQDEAMAKAVEMLRKVRMPEPQRRVRQYPHELSGGMRQRVMIAMALACGPRLLIADEPTTALDVTIQAQILELMRELARETGASIILITHDLGVVAEMAHRVVVMYAGRKVEEAPVEELFAQPRHPYTRGLLGSMPHLGDSVRGEGGKRLVEIPGMVPSLERGATRLPVRTALPERDRALRKRSAAAHCARSESLGGLLESRAMNAPGDVLLEVQGLRKFFPTKRGMFARGAKVHAVDGVSFWIRDGETLGLVGESGCGKIHHRQAHSAAAGSDRGPHPVARPAHRSAQPGADASGATRAASGVPGPLFVAQSAHARGRHRGRADSQLRVAACGRSAAARGGTFRVRRPAGRPDGEVSVRVLRRPTPAARHRASAVGATASDRLRRAGVGARCVGPGAGDQLADGPAGASSSFRICSSRTIWRWSSISAIASR